MTDHISGALGDLIKTARALAKKLKLERDGVIYCCNCQQRPALIPSLHCHLCLTAHHKQRGTVGICINREQTPADAEACRL